MTMDESDNDVDIESEELVIGKPIIATFRLEYEDEYEFKVLSTCTSKFFAPQA